jgi:hypothetical protein
MGAINPVLRELGFGPEDRVAVVHADDIGMCRSTLAALEELLTVGVVTSASALVPCRWFPEVAAWRRRNVHADLGVHLTLTSEWDTVRWAPLSTGSRRGGLIDGEGYFHRTTRALREHATCEAVLAECASQIGRAEGMGLGPTHVDTHMFAALVDRFCNDYLQAAFDRGLPAFLPRRHVRRSGARPAVQEEAGPWEARGLPVFDHYEVATQRSRPIDPDLRVREAFRRLPAGLSCILLHPATDTEELRSMTEGWPGRVADFEAFRRPSLRDEVRRLGVQILSYGPLREVMRSRRRRHGDSPPPAR